MSTYFRKFTEMFLAIQNVWRKTPYNLYGRMTLATVSSSEHATTAGERSPSPIASCTVSSMGVSAPASNSHSHSRAVSSLVLVAAPQRGAQNAGIKEVRADGAGLCIERKNMKCVGNSFGSFLILYA